MGLVAIGVGVYFHLTQPTAKERPAPAKSAKVRLVPSIGARSSGILLSPVDGELVPLRCARLVGARGRGLVPGRAGHRGQRARSEPGSGGTGGAPDAQSGPTGADPVPPGRPPGEPVPGGGATRWFAARTIFIGTHDPETRKADKTAWRRIGHDIDGECTTLEISKSNSSATCKQPSAASVDSLEDGDDCRDNAAGRLVAVGTQVVSINFEPELHAGLLTAETPTYILRLDDLSGDADDPYVRGALYVSVPRNPAFEKAPSWDGADQFTIDQASTDAPAGADAGDGGTADAGPKDGGGDAAPPSPLVRQAALRVRQGLPVEERLGQRRFRQFADKGADCSCSIV